MDIGISFRNSTDKNKKFLMDLVKEKFNIDLNFITCNYGEALFNCNTYDEFFKIVELIRNLFMDCDFFLETDNRVISLHLNNYTTYSFSNDIVVSVSIYKPPQHIVNKIKQEIFDIYTYFNIIHDNNDEFIIEYRGTNNNINIYEILEKLMKIPNLEFESLITIKNVNRENIMFVG